MLKFFLDYANKSDKHQPMEHSKSITHISMEEIRLNVIDISVQFTRMNANEKLTCIYRLINALDGCFSENANQRNPLLDNTLEFRGEPKIAGLMTLHCLPKQLRPTLYQAYVIAGCFELDLLKAQIIGVIEILNLERPIKTADGKFKLGDQFHKDLLLEDVAIRELNRELSGQLSQKQKELTEELHDCLLHTLTKNLELEQPRFQKAARK